VPDGDDAEAYLLSDDEDWDRTSSLLEASAARRLARSLMTVAEYAGFSLRLYWSGDPVEQHETLELEDLLSRLVASELRKDTVYTARRRLALDRGAEGEPNPS
jgi:hypothetical protein